MTILQNISILVTGAQGFLGSVIKDYLSLQGARVVGTGRNPINQYDRNMIIADLEDMESLKALNAGGTYEAVIHCAAVLPRKRHDLDVLIANQEMTSNLLEWATSTGVAHFLFASSCNVYGYSNLPCTEQTVPAPPNYYAISKLACEHMVSQVGKSGEMRVCSLRISAPYGPNLEVVTVIKRFIQQAARQEPITLMGSGSRSQDFVYQEDVARAFSLAITRDAGGTFNVSGGQSISMRVLAESILELFGIEPAHAIRLGGIDPQEEYRGDYPFAAAAETFGYLPQVALVEGLRQSAQAWGYL